MIHFACMVLAVVGLVPRITYEGHPAGLFEKEAPTFCVAVSNLQGRVQDGGELEVVVTDYGGRTVISNRTQITKVGPGAEFLSRRFELPNAGRNHYSVRVRAFAPGYGAGTDESVCSALGGMVARDLGKFGVNLVYLPDAAAKASARRLLELAGMRTASVRAGKGLSTHRGGNACGGFGWQHRVMENVVRKEGKPCDIPNACANTAWGLGGQWKGLLVPYEDKVLLEVLSAAACTNCASFRYFSLFDGNPENYGISEDRIGSAKAQTWWPVKQGLATEPKAGGLAKPGWMAFQFAVWLADGASDWRFDVRRDGIRCVSFLRRGIRWDVVWLNDPFGVLPRPAPDLGRGHAQSARGEVVLRNRCKGVRCYDSIGRRIDGEIRTAAGRLLITERLIVVEGGL